MRYFSNTVLNKNICMAVKYSQTQRMYIPECDARFTHQGTLKTQNDFMRAAILDSPSFRFCPNHAPAAGRKLAL